MLGIRSSDVVSYVRLAAWSAAALAVSVAGGIGLGALVTGPLASTLDREVDGPLVRWSLSHPNGSWESLLKDVERLGSVRVAFAIAVGLGLVAVVIFRSIRPLVQMLLAFGGAATLTVVIRQVVDRPAEYGPVKGFPSGHTLLAVAIGGTAIVLALRSRGPRFLRAGAVVGFTIVTIAISWARIYLLSHLATDVLGSAVLGIGWVVAVDRLMSADLGRPAGAGARIWRKASGSMSRTGQPTGASAHHGATT
jgi:membrane-associated phospholipid phosphatase